MGINSIILPNVTIGDNCIIGAGSVVTRDIPSGSVAVGTPARVIKSVDQYYESIKDKVTYIRGLSEKKKKEFLLEKFNL